jgi:hypothetical protein
MGKSKIPNVLVRRHLIEKELSETQALEIGEAYLDEGRSEEALIFFEKAGANERLRELRAAAVASGDVFLLRGAARAMGEAPSRDEWTGAQVAATAAGRLNYAADAKRQLEVDAEG